MASETMTMAAAPTKILGSMKYGFSYEIDNNNQIHQIRQINEIHQIHQNHRFIMLFIDMNYVLIIMH